MKKRILTICLSFALLAFWGCSSNSQTGEEGQSATEEGTPDENTTTEETAESNEVASDEMSKDGISLYPMSDSPSYPDAKLSLASPAGDAKVAAGSVPFNFAVENYKLGVQTDDAAVKDCANSAKGQHIHLILNNTPYSAHYEANFSRDLEDGHYVALAFLSRSYHESLKQDGAFLVTQFTVGSAEPQPADLSAQHLFYSRPKGDYAGQANTERVMLDFYLVNTEISPEGNKVKATINGSTEFLISKWVPYIMEGLPMGENTIKLELVDNAGNLVEGGFNSVERTFTLSDLQ